MRRLLAYIVILTGVLSAAINAGSTWAYTHPNPAACLFIRSRKGSYAFDIATGKILGLSNGEPINRAISNGGEIVPNGNYSLYDEKETTTIYLQTPFEERRKIQENAWLQTFAWSPNKALVAYLWRDNIGNYSITILNLKSGETYTIPIKPTVAKGFFHWTADNQTLVYKFEDLSMNWFKQMEEKGMMRHDKRYSDQREPYHEHHPDKCNRHAVESIQARLCV